MKKILSIVFIILICLFTCCKKDESISIYMPDGAPALVFAKAMNEEKEYNFHVVGSEEIGSFVANRQADVALLPINLASKLAGDGEMYKLVSVNTHGNLYIITKEYDSINCIVELVGKKVAVVNLANIPGITLKALLKNNDINFVSDVNELNSTNVYLENIDAGEIPNKLKNNLVDYVLCPEPQKSKILSQVEAFKEAASLQELWGEPSYPQACLIVKKELCKKEFIEKIKGLIDGTSEWIKTNTELAVELISKNAVGGKSSLVASALTPNAIDGSNIKFVYAREMKDQINDYIDSIIEINSKAALKISDGFYYE